MENQKNLFVYVCHICVSDITRRDSFITHRAFCDALAQESVRAQTLTIVDPEVIQRAQIAVPLSSSSPPPPPLTPSTAVLSPAHSIQSSEVPENPTGLMQPPPTVVPNIPTTIASSSSTSSGTTTAATNNNSIFATIFTSAPPPPEPPQPSQSPSSFSDMLCSLSTPECNLLEPPMSLSLSSSLYLSTQEQAHHYAPPQSQTPALSATALLQKAAQMGATGSSSSFLRGLGLDINLSSQSNNNSSTMSRNVKPESYSFGLGLGLPSGGDQVMGPTLDFLGLGIGAGSASTAGFSALLDSISSGLDVASFGDTNGNENQPWKDPSKRKPPML